MPTAIPELIIAEVKSRLEAITTANGYDVQVAGVDRVNRLGEDFTPRHLGVVIVTPSEERNTSHDRPGNPPVIAYRLPVSISVFVRLPEGTNDREDTAVNAIQAAIKKSITNASDWYTFGGNGYNAEWGVSEKFESTDHMGVTIELVSLYRVSELDPFTALP